MSRRMKKVVKSDPNQLTGAGTVTLTVVQATDLAAMDSNGKSDPFCKIKTNFGSQVFQTHTVKKSLNPQWGETFPIYVGELEESQTITVNIYDRNFVGQELIGEVTVSLKLLIDAPTDTLEDWFTVGNEPKKNYNKGEKKPAKINLKFHYPKGADLRGAIKFENPTKYYNFTKKLGRGAFAQVKKAVHKETGKEFAVKIVKKKKMNEQQKTLLSREIGVMAKLHHTNIVELVEAFDSPKKTYLVLELIEGGELFDEIISRTEPYYEKDAADIIRQVTSGVEYIHKQGIAHRDLKPENLLLTRDKKTVKISDFGLSKDFSQQTMVTSCGTAIYVAPEVLMGTSYGTSCDVWSVGVISFVLLSGCIPFEGQTENQVFENILRCNYGFPEKTWSNISEEAKDFIRKIFVLDVNQRPSATECLQHPWLLKEAKDHPTESLQGFKQMFKEFNESQAQLKKNEEDQSKKLSFLDDFSDSE